MPGIEKIFSKNDLVLSTCQKGGVMSGGFILSDITKTGKSITSGGGGSIMSALKDLAVPAGLFYAATQVEKLIPDEKDGGVIDDKVYKQLVDTAEKSSSKESKSKKSTTRRKKKSSKKTTRKKK